MRVACFGELLIDFVANENNVEVGAASGFQKAPGGAPANVAVAVKRLGQDAAFLGQVGDDPFGHYLADVLKEDNHINIEGLHFSKEARTMLAFVALNEGDRSFQFYRHPSADMLMTPDQLNKDVLDASDVFHFGSITLIPSTRVASTAKETTLAAVQYASKQGKLISYDPNLRLALWDSTDDARAGMRLGLNYAHIVKVSAGEEMQTILDAGEQLSDWWDTFPQLQVIAHTDGEHGSTIYTREGAEYNHGGYQVGVVDTTGAGDTFMAGLVVQLLEQRASNPDWATLDYGAAVRFANAAGAIATTGRGAIPAIPTREQVAQFLAD